MTDEMRPRGLAEVILTWIIKFMILTFVLTFCWWAVLLGQATTKLESTLDELIAITTKSNCLDATIGEYQRFEGLLYQHNTSTSFMRYALHVEGATRILDSSSDIWQYKITDSSLGNDGFMVKKGRDSSGTDNYRVDTAPQKYEPIYVRLEMYVYMPMPVYFGKTFDAFHYDPRNSMVPTNLPTDATTNGGNPDKVMPALRITIMRDAVIMGTKYYKGLAIGS